MLCLVPYILLLPISTRLFTEMGLVNDSKSKLVVSNIRKIRAERNYTQDYLAAKLGISQNAYSKIELGYSSITLNRMISIAEILGVDLMDFLSIENYERSKLKLVNDSGH